VPDQVNRLSLSHTTQLKPLITAGEDESGVREVVRIDTRREFAVTHCPPMLTPREVHAAVYHTPHLYILGGWNGSSYLSECERYVCAENRWEALPPLPRACYPAACLTARTPICALSKLIKRGGVFKGRVFILTVSHLLVQLLKLPISKLRTPSPS
jgi:hypothetical protein